MPRKGHTVKRTVPADAVYGSNLVTKFINSMMWQGKRSTAEGIFYEALGKVQAKGRRRGDLKICSPRQLKTRSRCSK
jgi:small subunit ribosomal protein S7